MEQRPELKSRGVSFNGKWRNTSLSRAFKHSTTKNQSFSSIDNQCLDTSRSPPHAMQFLCRSWSPSASDFQQLFSLNNNFFPPHTNDRTDEQEEMKVEETLENQAMRSTCIITNKEEKTWMDVKHMTGWLKGKSLTSFLRSHKEKKKEKARLHTAKLHAAISLTQLAAAIAGFATNCTAEAQGITHMTTGGGTLACDQDMGSVVASAAALLTTVCAEAAESLGAKRTRVASAVNSGLATQTPIDVITLTATAATCLRGAATLKSRGKAETYFPRNQELLKVGVQTLIIMPSGEKGFKWVRIHLKQRQLTLSFRNKYFGGALTTSKEYKIINVIEEIKEAKGSNFLSLKTNKGIIKLFFDDEKQSIIWISTISNMLQTCNSY